MPSGAGEVTNEACQVDKAADPDIQEDEEEIYRRCISLRWRQLLNNSRSRTSRPPEFRWMKVA
jgi:hypothetical protein